MDVKPPVLCAEFLTEKIGAILTLLEEILDRDSDCLRADRVRSDILKSLSCYREIVQNQAIVQFEMVDVKMENTYYRKPRNFKTGKTCKTRKKSQNENDILETEMDVLFNDDSIVSTVDASDIDREKETYISKKKTKPGTILKKKQHGIQSSSLALQSAADPGLLKKLSPSLPIDRQSSPIYGDHFSDNTQHVVQQSQQVTRHTCSDCDVSYVHSYFLDEHRRSHYCKGRRMRCWGNLKGEQQGNNGICPLCGVKFSQTYNLKRHMILHKFYQLKSSDLNASSNDITLNKETLESVKECNGKDNTECFNSFISSNLNNTNLNENADFESVSNEESALYSGLWSKSRICGLENDGTKVSGENLGFKYSIEGVVYKINDEQVECDTCKKKFHDKHLLETHVKLVHIEKIKPLVCNYCWETFSLLIQLVYHAKRYHKVKMTDGKNYYLATSKDLKNKSFPTDITFKVFACKECPRVYPTLRQLQDHSGKNHFTTNPKQMAKTFHRDKKRRGVTRIKRVDKKYPCPDCEKICLSYGGLRAHLATHSDAPPSICDVCGKSFKERHALLTHIKIHSAPKYICDQCGSMHKAIGNLTRHMLLHKDIKMYKCNICEKPFRLYDNLKYHIKIHTGEKPYPCDMCDSRFREKRAWMTHVNNHRNIKPFKCQTDHCGKEFVDKKQLKKHMLAHCAVIFKENN